MELTLKPLLEHFVRNRTVVVSSSASLVDFSIPNTASFTAPVAAFASMSLSIFDKLLFGLAAHKLGNVTCDILTITNLQA
jgi:hypothetical protein